MHPLQIQIQIHSSCSYVCILEPPSTPPPPFLKDRIRWSATKATGSALKTPLHPAQTQIPSATPTTGKWQLQPAAQRGNPKSDLYPGQQVVVGLDCSWETKQQDGKPPLKREWKTWHKLLPHG